MKAAGSALLPRIILLAAVLLFFFSGAASAHCDGLDGPVVKAARQALESRNVNLVLVWVQNNDEAELRRAFDHTLAVRALGPQAKELADRYFLEILVRLHRTGEGAPYTGLKPAGRNLGPAIPAADRAIEQGSAEELEKLLSEAMLGGLHQHFQKAVASKKFQAGDVVAGRVYVAAYVEFIHYVERLYEDATLPAEGHFRESPEAPREQPGMKHHLQSSLATRESPR